MSRWTLLGLRSSPHAHNAESIAEIRAEIGVEKSAVGENDAIATHAQLLAEKRFEFFALTFGLTMYLAGLAAGVVAARLIAAVFWTRIVDGRVRDQAARAEKNGYGEELPEQ